MTDGLTERGWCAIPWTDHVVCPFCVERAQEAPRAPASLKGKILLRPTLRDRVRDFFVIADQAVAEHPHVPDDKTVRFRMRLIAEEFLESLEAAFAHTGEFELVRHHLHHLVDTAPVRVDLPKLVDAFADLDYVVEGARVAFGVDGEPVMALVHAANMAKAGGPVVGGKKLKPKGWVAPDILGELRSQGWTG
jgi:predicted HAD superfamily Cof-like phosphohydrolase